jgi:hypothetical protein
MDHHRSVAGRAFLTLALFTAATVAAAQSYEFVYGPTATVERAMRGVTPVQLCPGGGSIAVGTTGNAPNNRVYVTRTTNAGGPMWERTFDLGAAGGETGESLVELRDGTGFVIVGTTRPGLGLSLDAFLLKIDCNGFPMWARAHHSPGDEGALNIVEARTGNAAFGTSRGDLIVAGFAPDPTSTAGGQIGLLLRTKANGGLIWNRRYVVPGFARFTDLLEARPVASPTGDVVAAGRIVPPGGPAQGYVLRVSGDHGFFVAAPHCAATYEAGTSARFEALTEITGGALAGGLVMAGTAFDPVKSNDVYLVRTKDNPCHVEQQSLVGDVSAAAIGNETGLDIREVPFALPLAPAGSLAVTGSAANTFQSDAFLMIADVWGLKPIPGPGHIYGRHASGREIGQSLALAPNGFFIAGSTNTDYQGVGDPSDFYLVKPDVNGRTNCALGWDPPYVPSTKLPVPISPSPSAFLQTVSPLVTTGFVFTPFNACP